MVEIFVGTTFCAPPFQKCSRTSNKTSIFLREKVILTLISAHFQRLHEISGKFVPEKICTMKV